MSAIVAPARPQPQQSHVGCVSNCQAGHQKFAGAKCMRWTASRIAPSHTLSVSELSAKNKKGGNATLAVSSDARPPDQTTSRSMWRALLTHRPRPGHSIAAV